MNELVNKICELNNIITIRFYARIYDLPNYLNSSNLEIDIFMYHSKVRIQYHETPCTTLWHYEDLQYVYRRRIIFKYCIIITNESS